MTIRQVNNLGGTKGDVAVVWLSRARSRCACPGSGLMNHQEGVLVTMEFAACDMPQPQCDSMSADVPLKQMVTSCLDVRLI